MAHIRIYRNPECERCARLARLHKRLDWLGRIEVSTAAPPGRAPLRKGEIAVEDLRTGRLFEGVEAVRAIARNVPAYLVLLPLLAIPAIARTADADARGLAGKACAPDSPVCEVPSERSEA